jgi:hypothetical protein
MCNCSEDVEKSFLILVAMCAGGSGGFRNACETVSVKLPKCWNALLTSKYLELAMLNSVLGSQILQWHVPFCLFESAVQDIGSWYYLLPQQVVHALHQYRVFQS